METIITSPKCLYEAKSDEKKYTVQEHNNGRIVGTIDLNGVLFYINENFSLTGDDLAEINGLLQRIRAHYINSKNKQATTGTTLKKSTAGAISLHTNMTNVLVYYETTNLKLKIITIEGVNIEDITTDEDLTNTVVATTLYIAGIRRIITKEEMQKWIVETLPA